MQYASTDNPLNRFLKKESKTIFSVALKIHKNDAGI